MSYIFEDHPDDSLSRLFKNGYPETVQSEFIYAKSISNVNEFVKQELRKTTDEIIFVFMDLVPNNINLVQVYKKLSKKSQKSNYRIIVFPLVCAEYYFICTLPKYTILDEEAANLCINRLPFDNSKIVQYNKKKSPNTFEQFCKLFLDRGVIDCIKRDSFNNSMYDFYFDENYKCKASLKDCMDLTLQEKSKQFLEKYPCIPGNHIFGDKEEITIDLNDAWKIHRKLVDEFNHMSDRFKANNNMTNGYYEHIDYIK